MGQHLQKHLDEDSREKNSEGMNRDLLKVFEKYKLGDKSMLCLWRLYGSAVENWNCRLG